jgi:transposase
MTMTDMASAAAGHDGAVASGKGPRAGQPKRRAFTAAYKARILREYDELESGRERGALLRREGLYSSHIDGWRKAREAGTANGLTEKPAGRPGRRAADKVVSAVQMVPRGDRRDAGGGHSRPGSGGGRVR